MEENKNEEVKQENCVEDNELNSVKLQLEETTDRLKRLMAEFDNFKKRTAKEKEELFSMGVCTAVEKLLLVKDTLERAIPTMEGAEATAIADGVKMIDKQFSDALSEIGVEPIPSVGEEFDPEKHNAIMHDENEEFGENTISEEFMKGYMYKENKVVRHSMVKVSN
jgi:molecular chaperone GrpE